MGCEQIISVLSEDEEQSIPILGESQERGIDVQSEPISVTIGSNYETLTNKPQINGVELVGNKTSAEIGVLVRTDTTANWESASGFIPRKGEVIVYEDYQTKTYTVEEYGEQVTRTVNIPAIKIGTGNAYVQDLAFVGDDIRDRLMSHINDMNLHVTLGEKAFWNNKINVDDAYDIAHEELEDETLVLNRN